MFSPGSQTVKEFYRSPQMPYEFLNLTNEEKLQEKDRVKKDLERQLYGLILKLSVNPASYDTSAHTVPDDEFAENYAVKLDIARVLSNINFLNSL
jgi:hypothetical protein